MAVGPEVVLQGQAKAAAEVGGHLVDGIGLHVDPSVNEKPLSQ